MKRKLTQAQFDLAALRKLKRLTKRVYTGLQEMERHILRMERQAKQGPADVGVPLS